MLFVAAVTMAGALAVSAPSGGVATSDAVAAEAVAARAESIPPGSVPDEEMRPTETAPSRPETPDTMPEPEVPTDDGDAAPASSEVIDTAQPRPSVSASVRDSSIPVGSIVLALLVLAAVGIAVAVIVRRQPEMVGGDDERDSDDGQVPDGGQDPDGGLAPAKETATERRVGSHKSTLDFLLLLGEALIDAGDSVSHVESTLRTIARVNGIAEIGTIVLPTALVVSVPGEIDAATEVSTAGRSSLRLDQVDDVLRLVTDAERGDVDGAEGRRRLTRIRSSDPPFSPTMAIIGYVCSTIGLAAILRGRWIEIVIAAGLGLAVGSFRMSTKRLGASYQPFIPLLTATGVSVAVFSLSRGLDDLRTFPLLISPLVTFLPGALLTIAVLELATGQMISGVARLASGGMQLVLLALGLVAGSQLVGVPAGDLGSDSLGPVAALAPWIGVAVFGVGIVWFNGARSSARVWILLVLYVAYAGQVIGGLFFGSALSAFFGALAMTPVAVLVARQPSGPSPLVTFLPGFWLLVPGALGLDGVTQLLGAGVTAGTGALVTAVTSMVGISLGILLGLALVAQNPERPWAEVRTADRGHRFAPIGRPRSRLR